jgi:hypothetical protein
LATCIQVQSNVTSTTNLPPLFIAFEVYHKGRRNENNRIKERRRKEESVVEYDELCRSALGILIILHAHELDTSLPAFSYALASFLISERHRLLSLESKLRTLSQDTRRIRRNSDRRQRRRMAIDGRKRFSFRELFIFAFRGTIGTFQLTPDTPYAVNFHVSGLTSPFSKAIVLLSMHPTK